MMSKLYHALLAANVPEEKAMMARASRCGKAAAFAGEHRNPPRL